jgi:L-asparaginase II
MAEQLAAVTRGGMVESVHLGHLLALGGDARDELEIGDASTVILPRSTVKPIQAATMVEAGLNLRSQLLALAAASHSGSAMHVSGVEEILASVGLTADALQCPADVPYGSAERREYGAQRRSKERIVHNCSGKHASMLATCVINGWPTDSYLSPEHPLQRLIAQRLSERADEAIALVTIDGCGAPLFALSLRGLARAISGLAVGDSIQDAQVVEAMVQHPEMVGGEGRSTTELMRAVDGLIVKEGAEGVQIAALRDGRTLAFKVADGSMRALPAITAAVLTRWGLGGEAVSRFQRVAVFGGADVVGEIVATGRLS